MCDLTTQLHHIIYWAVSGFQPFATESDGEIYKTIFIIKIKINK